ncbi:hypothetical protein Tco_0060589 [Tanacetum coccineum]
MWVSLPKIFDGCSTKDGMGALYPKICGVSLPKIMWVLYSPKDGRGVASYPKIRSHELGFSRLDISTSNATRDKDLESHVGWSLGLVGYIKINRKENAKAATAQTHPGWWFTAAEPRLVTMMAGGWRTCAGWFQMRMEVNGGDSGDDYGGDGVRRLQMVATWRLRRWGSEGNGVEVAEREIKVTRWRLVGWPEMGGEVEMIDDDDDGGSGVEWWLPTAGGRNLAWILPEKGDGVGKPKGGRRSSSETGLNESCGACSFPSVFLTADVGWLSGVYSLVLMMSILENVVVFGPMDGANLLVQNTLWAKDMDLRSLSGWADELDLVLNQVMI